MGFTPDFNLYRALEGNPLKWMDAMELMVPHYDPQDVSNCFTYLHQVVQGTSGLGVTPCASALLSRFLGGKGGGNHCPAACSTALSNFN